MSNRVNWPLLFATMPHLRDQSLAVPELANLAQTCTQMRNAVSVSDVWRKQIQSTSMERPYPPHVPYKVLCHGAAVGTKIGMYAAHRASSALAPLTQNDLDAQHALMVHLQPVIHAGETAPLLDDVLQPPAPPHQNPFGLSDRVLLAIGIPVAVVLGVGLVAGSIYGGVVLGASWPIAVVVAGGAWTIGTARLKLCNR